MRKSAPCLVAIGVLAGACAASAPRTHATAPSAGAHTCDDVGAHASKLAGHVGSRDGLRGSSASTVIGFAQDTPADDSGGDGGGVEPESDPGPVLRQQCVDDRWPQANIDCFVAAVNVGGARECFPGPAASVTGTPARGTSALCAGVEGMIARGPTFEGLKGDVIPDHPRTVNWQGHRTAWRVNAGSDRCVVLKIDSSMYVVCDVAKDKDLDQVTHAYHALVAELDTCTIPATWTRSEATGVAHMPKTVWKLKPFGMDVHIDRQDSLDDPDVSYALELWIGVEY